MKTMYSTKPAEGAYETKSGLYAMPVQTCHQKAMQANGWVYHERELKDGVRENEEVKEKQKDQEKPVTDRNILVEEYERRFGEKPHHKMKDETIAKKLQEVMNDD